MCPELPRAGGLSEGPTDPQPGLLLLPPFPHLCPPPILGSHTLAAKCPAGRGQGCSVSAHRPHQALASPDALTVLGTTGRGVEAGTDPVTRGRLQLALRSKGAPVGSGPKANIGSPPRAKPVFSPNLDQLCLQQTQPAMPACPHVPLPPTAFPELGEFWGCLSAGPAETKAQRTL